MAAPAAAWQVRPVPIGAPPTAAAAEREIATWPAGRAFALRPRIEAIVADDGVASAVASALQLLLGAPDRLARITDELSWGERAGLEALTGDPAVREAVKAILTRAVLAPAHRADDAVMLRRIARVRDAQPDSRK